MSSDSVSPGRTSTSPTACRLARGVLYTLVFIHFVLPFTPVNQHEETRILFASVILGILFLSLARVSYRYPRAAFSAGLIFLLFIYALSHATGASPIAEGWPVKLVFAAGLTAGTYTAHEHN